MAQGMIGTGRHIGAWMRADRWILGQVLLATGLSNLLGLATAVLVMAVYDRVLPAGATTSLLALGAGAGIALACDFALRLARGRLADAVALAAEHRLALAAGRAAAEGRGGWSDARVEGPSAALLCGLGDLPFVPIYLIAIWVVAGPLVALPLVALGGACALAAALAPCIARLAEAERTLAKGRARCIADLGAGGATLRAMAAQEGPLSELRRAADLHVGQAAALRGAVNWVVQVATLAQQAGQVGIVLWGALGVIEEGLSGGALIAAVLLTGRALAPVQVLAHLAQRLATLPAPVRAETARLPEAPALRRAQLRDSGPEFAIELRDLRCRALGSVSLRIAPGERIALTGPAGGGRSTLLRLLAGIETPEGGRVLVDGTDMERFAPECLGRHVGALLDPLWLPDGPLRMAVAAGRGVIDDAALHRAATASGLGAAIDADPRGFEMPVAALSGAQRRAAAIARAIAGRPRLLLLDDPSAGFDARAELALAVALETAAAGATVVMATHRPALLRLADRVVVLDRGRISADAPPGFFAAAASVGNVASSPQRQSIHAGAV
jgi:ATP-binding cassette subfamily C protein LapB